MLRKVVILLIVLGLVLAACAPIADAPVETATPEQSEEAAEGETGESTELETQESRPATPEQALLILEDDMGREIELPGPASAIVTLGPSVLESLFAIGANDQVVGREEFSTYPEEALDIPSVGSLWGELPVEAILALEPDLVIAPQIISPERVGALEDLGLAVYWQANPATFDELFANLRTLARLTGREAEAEELVASLAERVATIEQKLEGIQETPKVFYELDATDPENPFTVGAGTFIDTIIAMAGGSNIGAVLQGDYAQMSSEEIIVQNPDVILLADAPYGITPESVAARPGWEVITAVQNDQIVPFDPFLVSVPGPRLVDGLEAMAAILHPDLFE